MLTPITPELAQKVMFCYVTCDGDTRSLVKQNALVLHTQGQVLVNPHSTPCVDETTLCLLSQLGDFKHYLHRGGVRRNPYFKTTT